MISNLERTEYSHLRVTAPCGREAATDGVSVTPRTSCELPGASPNHMLDLGLAAWTRQAAEASFGEGCTPRT